jgi:hypothetical protein
MGNLQYDADGEAIIHAVSAYYGNMVVAISHEEAGYVPIEESAEFVDGMQDNEALLLVF